MINPETFGDPMSGSPNVVLLSMTDPLPDSAATKIMTNAGKGYAEISIQADFDWQCLAHLEDVQKESKTGREWLRENGYGDWLDSADQEDRISMLGWLKMITDMTQDMAEEEEDENLE